MLPFFKMHGAGNDFVVLPDPPPVPPAAAAVLLCDRRRGIGGDGLLLVRPVSDRTIRMDMFNPDGTRDDCGNGIRCAAHLAVVQGWADPAGFFIESLTGRRAVRVRLMERTEAEVAVEWGPAQLEPEAAPVLARCSVESGLEIEAGGRKLTLHPLFTGSTHAVIFEEPDEAGFQQLSPLLEHHPLFPERTSVIWTQLLSENRLKIRIWERGAGETLACGTGACAAAVAAELTGRVRGEVAVESRGGVLHVTPHAGQNIQIRGPSELLFAGAAAASGNEL